MLLSQKVKETVKLPSLTMRAREARVLCFRSALHSFIINSYVILDVVQDVAVGGRVHGGLKDAFAFAMAGQHINRRGKSGDGHYMYISIWFQDLTQFASNSKPPNIAAHSPMRCRWP